MPVGWIRGGSGHHDLDRALVIGVVRPVGTESDQLAVELDADAPAHADDHRLQPLLEVLYNILGHERQPLLRAYSVLSFSLHSTSSLSVASSKSGSIFGRSASSSARLASRLS